LVTVDSCEQPAATTSGAQTASAARNRFMMIDFRE
jgi:hypothetical protein